LPNEIIYPGELANSVCVRGQPLFEQDDADDRTAVDPARRLLQQAQDQLESLRSPAKPTEITQAQAKLRDAEAARD
jgi:multidrug resistance efflux pump